MSGSLSRRIAAVETQNRVNTTRRVFLFRPDGLDDAAYAAWEAEKVAPEVAAGAEVTIYQWSPGSTL